MKRPPFAERARPSTAQWKSPIRALAHSWQLTVLIAVTSFYYLFLLSNGTFQLFAPEMLDKAFANMLVHLLLGDFTVDRKAIDFEAFTRDGNTYAYFGIFSALLRLSAMPFTDIGQAELARLSCLAAVVIFVCLQLRMLLFVHCSLPWLCRRRQYLVVMIAATILSGPQIYILGSASIYHEPILWSAAMAAAFNFVIVRRAFDGERLHKRDLMWLAALAGLAINTRPSVGVALNSATILLLLWTVWCRCAPDRRAQGPSLQETHLQSIALSPAVVLGLGILVTGFVNFERWGNPLTFADFRYYDWLYRHPDFVDVFLKHGEFDVGRVWIGALYYATGVPYLLKGVPPFDAFLRSHVAGIEAPPITPLLTNPITILLAGIGVYRLWWKPQLCRHCASLLRLTLIGHASAVFLILAAMFFTLRFRFDFAPFMTLSTLIGYRSVCLSVAAAREDWQRRVLVTAVGLCALGILSSHYVLLIHKVWSIAVPMKVRLALLPFAPFAHVALEP